MKSTLVPSFADRRKSKWRGSAGLGWAVVLLPFLLPVLEARSQEQTPPPRTDHAYATGFEKNGGTRTTTREEEIELLTAVAADSPRMAFAQIAESVNGQPIHLVRIGYPQAPDEKTAEKGRNLLFVGAQHGNEPSGREGVLRLIRELAFTEDADLIKQLSQINILVIPTANPDGLIANKRRNHDNIDTNRDHLHLKTPETRAIAAVIRRYAPEILLDAHESGNPPNKPTETARLEALWPSHLNADADVQRLSREMIEDHLFPAVEAAGFESRQWKGRGDQPGVLRNMAGLRNGLGLVTESFRSTAAKRAELQFVTMQALLRFHRERSVEILQTVSRARETKTEIGASQTGPQYLAGTDLEAPAEDKVLREPPAGYLINRLQRESAAPHIEGFGLTHEEVETGAFFIPMSQPMMTVIPLLFDQRSTHRILAGVAVEDRDRIAQMDAPPLPPPPSEPARHFADFAAQPEGGPPEGWSLRWKPGQWRVEQEPRLLRHEVEEGSGRRALVWETAGELVGDVELYSLVQGKSSATLFQLALHVSGKAGKEDAYYVDLRLPANQFRINRYSGGRFQTLSSADYAGQTEAWHHVRFRRQGNQLMARIWQDGTEEPEAWTVTATDDLLHSGQVGFAGMQPKSFSQWAFLGVGVGGDAAPGRTE